MAVRHNDSTGSRVFDALNTALLLALAAITVLPLGYVLAGSFELPLVFVTSNHSIITFGPTLDATFYGQINPAGRAIKWRPYNQDELGVSAGVSLFF